MALDAPQVTITTADRKADPERFAGRKKANAACRSSFRGIVAAGAQAHRRSTARDGYGNASEISKIKSEISPQDGVNRAQGEPATGEVVSPFIQHAPSRGGISGRRNTVISEMTDSEFDAEEARLDALLTPAQKLGLL
jgi:hypothetical protein